MPKKLSSAPVKKPAAKKAARKTAVRKTIRTTAVRKTAAKKIVARKTVKKPAITKPATAKRFRAKVINQHPGNLVADASDRVAIDAIERANAKAERAARRPRKRTAVDIAAEQVLDQPAATSLVARVSDAIERELSKIERIIGNPTRIAPAQRI